MRLELFRHFMSFFDSHINHKAGPKGDHQSFIFYAFDLAATEITAKVYFFPKIRARACNQSNLEVILHTINSISDVSNDDLEACTIFRDFIFDEVNKDLEYEMLVIDLVSSTKSRFKIYFRSRDTIFNSVINIMILGGRIRKSGL